ALRMPRLGRCGAGPRRGGGRLFMAPPCPPAATPAARATHSDPRRDSGWCARSAGCIAARRRRGARVPACAWSTAGGTRLRRAGEAPRQEPARSAVPAWEQRTPHRRTVQACWLARTRRIARTFSARSCRESLRIAPCFSSRSPSPHGPRAFKRGQHLFDPLAASALFKGLVATRGMLRAPSPQPSLLSRQPLLGRMLARE